MGSDLAGYGQQVGLFAPLINEDYELAVSAFYGLEGARTTWQGIPTFPSLGGEFGNGYLLDHAARWFDGDLRSGILMTLMDVWVLDPRRIAQTNACCWVPVDHNPTPPAVENFFDQSGAIPIAMSRFGEEQLERFSPLYVPHGVDVDAYKPYGKAAMREATGVPKDAFLIGMVSANKGIPSRKGFQQAFEAFRIFHEKHENAILYLHTTMDPQIGPGEDLASLLAALDIPESAVMYADQYRMNFDPWPRKAMGRIYSTLDVLLNPAQGEGFGVPQLEAQACGTPVIATDFSAMKEVVKAGWKVEWRPQWTGQKSWQAVADVPSIVSALEECISLSQSERKKLSKEAREHALTYAAPKVYRDHFLPALQEVEKRLLKPSAPSVPAKVVAA